MEGTISNLLSNKHKLSLKNHRKKTLFNKNDLQKSAPEMTKIMDQYQQLNIKSVKNTKQSQNVNENGL